MNPISSPVVPSRSPAAGGAAVIIGLMCCVLGCFPFLNLLTLPFVLLGIVLGIAGVAGAHGQKSLVYSGLLGLGLSALGAVIAISLSASLAGLANAHAPAGGGHAPATQSTGNEPANVPMDNRPATAPQTTSTQAFPAPSL